MAQPDEERKALGRRLAAARKLADFTMEGAAKALTQDGYPITKQGIGHWESGRNIPDALWIKRLAQLYSTSADAIVMDNGPSSEGMRIASEYERLTPTQKDAWHLLWMGFTARQAGAERPEIIPVEPGRDLLPSRKVS